MSSVTTTAADLTDTVPASAAELRAVAAEAKALAGLKPGDRVELVTPDNPRLNGAAATVRAVESWGAHVDTPAAAAGRFRAAWHEMRVVGRGPVKAGGQQTGRFCPACGGAQVVRTGSCETCQDCGHNEGCG
jgi:hypothetical protein